MRKSDMSINFKSIKVWTEPPPDIRISDSLNVFMDNLMKIFSTFHNTEFFTKVSVIFCDMLYFCVMCQQ